jgi:hypothetical protein
MGGMTPNSCEKGESIYPWGITYGEILERYYPDKYSYKDKERYSQKCYSFHGACGEIEGVREQHVCYATNINLFLEKEDCVGLLDSKYSSKTHTIRELCELDVEYRKKIQHCFSASSSSKYTPNDFRLLNICMADEINISFINAKNTASLLTMTDSQIWRLCKDQYNGVAEDICVSNLAWLSQRRKVCGAILHDELLKEICFNSIEKK